MVLLSLHLVCTCLHSTPYGGHAPRMHTASINSIHVMHSISDLPLSPRHAATVSIDGCRGGIGRAGMIAACVLLKLGKALDAADAISQVRSLRSFRAVQTTRQEDFVHYYNSAWLTRTRSCDHNNVAIVATESAHGPDVQLPGKPGCLAKASC